MHHSQLVFAVLNALRMSMLINTQNPLRLPVPLLAIMAMWTTAYMASTVDLPSWVKPNSASSIRRRTFPPEDRSQKLQKDLRVYDKNFFEDLIWHPTDPSRRIGFKPPTRSLFSSERKVPAPIQYNQVIPGDHLDDRDSSPVRAGFFPCGQLIIKVAYNKGPPTSLSKAFLKNLCCSLMSNTSVGHSPCQSASEGSGLPSL